MRTTIPVPVRQAIVRLHREGGTYAEIADVLAIGEATVSRTLRRHRETGGVQPLPRGGGNSSPIKGDAASLLETLVGEMPDATAVELAQAMKSRGDVSTSRSAVQRALHRLGFTKKRRFVASERDNDAHRACRERFCEALAELRPEQRIFLDESYCKTGMRREHAWARRGERAISYRPFRRWKAPSLIGAIRLGARPRLMTHDGAVNGWVFLHLIRKYVAPWLRPGVVVLMDNLTFHKMIAVRHSIEAAGGVAISCPPTAPSSTTIELWWADMKPHLRKAAVDTGDGLGAAVERLRTTLSPSKLCGWFCHSFANHVN